MTHYEISRPLPSQVAELWACMEPDLPCMANPPATRMALVESWGDSMLLFSGLVDARIAALFIVDHTHFNEEGSFESGWVTIYVKPEFRGQDGFKLAQLACAKAHTWGAKALYTACLFRNKAAQIFAKRLGFREYERTDTLIRYRLDMRHAKYPSPHR